MGVGVSDFVSVGHIFAFLSSNYTFSSRARILKCQSRIYHSALLVIVLSTVIIKVLIAQLPLKI